MKIKRFLTACLILSAMISSAAAFAGPIQWVTSHEEAFARAKAENKPVMIDFFTTWCGWCHKLDQDTYTDPAVQRLAEKFVCAKIDADKNRSFAVSYRVNGYPTVLFTDASGRVIGGGPGYKDADRMATEMREALKKSGISAE